MKSVVDVNEGQTRREAAKFAITPLQEAKANLLGVIMNDRSFPIPGWIYKLV